MRASDLASSLDLLVGEIDILIRARYPLLAITTFEELRFRRLMLALSRLELHNAKGLFWWGRITGLRHISGVGLGPTERTIPYREDPLSVLEYIAAAERGLYVLADYGAYLAPFGQEEPQLVRRLRELAWTIKSRPVTVFFVGPTFPEIPALEKEVKVVDLPLPEEREVGKLLAVELGRLADNPDVQLKVDERAHEQLVQALLGLTETEIENALAKAAITFRGIVPEAIPLILDEKRTVIRQIGSLSYSHPEPIDHLGGYANLRKLLQEAAVTFTPAARSFGVEPSKGLLLVGLPGCGKDLCKKIASGIFGRPLLDLDMAALMGEGGGVIGSAGVAMKRALSIATTLKAVLGLSEFEKGVGGLQSSAKSDAGETARTIGALLSWM
jgi:hypothetical protein